MRKRVSPALVISTVALFFSLAGAGLAANHYLITSTSQIAPSVLHSLRGATGPAGPQGEAGPTGVTGSQGPAGSAEQLVFGFAYGERITIPAGQSATATAGCALDGQLVGGAYQGEPGLVVTTSGPEAELLSDQGADVWIITAENQTSEPLTLRAFADCAYPSN